MPDAPKAPVKPHTHVLHGDQRPDPYAWLRDRDAPDVIAYLEAENRYCDEVMRPLADLRNRLHQDMLKRQPLSEHGVPVQYGPYFYYWRIDPGADYRSYYRKRAATRSELAAAPEELLLDANALAVPDAYFDIAQVTPSPDHRRLLYLDNHDGTDRFTLHLRDLTTGRPVADPIRDVFLEKSVAWGAAGTVVYYVTVDAAQRPYQLHRRHLHDGRDEVLFTEPDVRYQVSIQAAASGQYLLLTSQIASVSSEVWHLRLDQPDSALTRFRARQPAVMYQLEHWLRDGSDQFLVLTNEHAENFAVMTAPTTAADGATLSPLIAAEPGRYLEQVRPFASCLVLAGREEGLAQVWIYRDGQLKRLEWDEPLYTATPGVNLAYDTQELLVEYQSLVTPRSDRLVDLATGQGTWLAQDQVRGYDPNRYDQRQEWATAPDGVRIPVSLVARREVFDHLPAPLILYGYGAYGASSDPEFQAERLPLLDRGVIYAIAHVRGGAELGRAWYEHGKLLHKMNTFTDFVAVAEHLVQQGYTRPSQLAAEGASAGGLLMGAVINLRPELFCAVAAGVPFVDAVTTMLDASIPLTALEWDEWGDPHQEEFYTYMKSYSPYDNVRAQAYPHLYVVAGLNDPRVGYFEPAKWVARLRALKTDNHDLVLRTHMGSGHYGTSGRLGHLKDEADQYAFLLDKLGIHA